MDMRRALTILSGLLAAVATAVAFRLFPIDLTSPVTLLWIPLGGGAVFINTFGFAALALLVPYEVMTHYLSGQHRLHVIESDPIQTPSGEVTAGAPAIATKSVA